MALVDWEAVALDIQGHVRTKKSFGQRELTDFIADSIEAHRQAEGLVPRALRLYGPELVDYLTERSATGRAAGSNGNDRDVAHS